MLPHEVFLSHSSKDHVKARRLKEILGAHGIPVWFSPHKIVGARQWHDEIGSALERCDWFMVLLTPHAAKSPWVKRELVFALENAQYNDHVIPLVFSKGDYKSLSWVLSQLQRVDFSRSFKRGLRKLLEIWEVALDEAALRRFESE